MRPEVDAKRQGNSSPGTMGCLMWNTGVCGTAGPVGKAVHRVSLIRYNSHIAHTITMYKRCAHNLGTEGGSLRPRVCSGFDALIDWFTACRQPPADPGHITITDTRFRRDHSVRACGCTPDGLWYGEPFEACSVKTLGDDLQCQHTDTAADSPRMLH